ncbi:MAG: hypothetical protein ACM33C_00780 [Syntrophaceae bacterium]
MSGFGNARASRNSYVLAFLFLMLPALACKTPAPPAPTSTPVPASTLPPTATPKSENRIQVKYPTGIETVRFEDGVLAVIDHKGAYGIGFPKQWEAGAFHEDFLPTVHKYARINLGLESLFQTIYGQDDSLRFFAIDTSPDHLTKDSFAALHVGMYQEQWRLEASLEELAAEYARYLSSSGQLEIIDTFQGQTNDGVPFALFLTEPVSTEGMTPAYGAVALIKTDKVYLEILYTTFDKTIDILDELRPILASFNTVPD